jgi:hypothetical protein
MVDGCASENNSSSSSSSTYTAVYSKTIEHETK